jgi:2,3-bisphosphoglycerate-dependent phosphoglycerate mutase
MQLYFIRHGQSENNRLWALTGSWDGRNDDPDLTTLGREQAAKLAQFLAQPGTTPVSPEAGYDPQNVGGFAITHLYCSLMLRAVATGMVVARVLGLPLVAWEDVHEVGGINRFDVETGERTGEPGKDRRFFEEYFPDLVLPQSLGEEGWWNRPFEQREQRPARARRFLDDLLDRHGGTDHRVAVISHGGFHTVLLRTLLNIPQETDAWFALANTGITRVDFHDEGIALHYINRTDFLPREWIT